MMPQWKLERYALGELPEADQKAVADEIARDPQVARQWQTLQDSNRLFFEQNDPESAAKRIQAMASARRTSSESTSFLAWIWKPAAALATLGIAALIGTSVMTSGIAPDQAIAVAQIESPDSGIRVKGLQNRLELWQKTGDSIVMILDGAKANKGDLLQIRTQVNQKCFAAVLSLDGRGNWSTHLPEQGTGAVAMEPGNSGFLPFSYQLDDAPKYEVFWLVTSDSLFSVDSLVKGLSALSGSPIPPPVLPLGARFTQTRLAVIK